MYIDTDNRHYDICKARIVVPNEVLAAQLIIGLCYLYLSSQSARNKQLLNNCIIVSKKTSWY